LTSAARLGALLIVAALTVLGAADVARADGDPASDVLYTGKVFVPFDTGVSQGAQETLTTAISEAERAGYPIRVALIERQVDLGAITALWGKPKEYARFLDLELAFIYKGPLLIVMPSGIGFAHYHRPTTSEYRALARVPVQTGPDGVALTATKAVSVLAAEAGHPIDVSLVPQKESSSALGQRVLAGGIALALVVVALGAFAFVRRRRWHG
jgi:hypothetical protein